MTDLENEKRVELFDQIRTYIPKSLMKVVEDIAAVRKMPVSRCVAIAIANEIETAKPFNYEVELPKKTDATLSEKTTDSVKTIHTFYLIGDAGNAEEQETQNTLALLEENLKQSDKNATLLFLGDNIYPKGMPPKKKDPQRPLAETKLKNQLRIAENFKGKTIFIPGNHDWYHGIKGLKEQEEFVNDYLKAKKAFLPQNSCALESVGV